MRVIFIEVHISGQGGTKTRRATSERRQGATNATCRAPSSHDTPPTSGVGADEGFIRLHVARALYHSLQVFLRPYATSSVREQTIVAKPQHRSRKRRHRLLGAPLAQANADVSVLRRGDALSGRVRAMKAHATWLAKQQNRGKATLLDGCARRSRRCSPTSSAFSSLIGSDYENRMAPTMSSSSQRSPKPQDVGKIGIDTEPQGSTGSCQREERGSTSTTLADFLELGILKSLFL